MGEQAVACCMLTLLSHAGQHLCVLHTPHGRASWRACSLPSPPERWPQLGTFLPCNHQHLPTVAGSLKGAQPSPGKDHRPAPPARLDVSPSMEHLRSLSTVQSSASVASLASAAGGEGETAALLGGTGPATAAAMARAPALLPR